MNSLSKNRRWSGHLINIWQWLIEPSSSVVKSEQRLQARLLMAMLLVLIVLGVFSLILIVSGSHTTPGESEKVTSMFVWITVAGLLLMTVEYGLSRTVHYPLAAVLAVGTVLGATFVTVIVNPHDLRSASFLILGGLIGSLFFSVRATAFVFIVTFIGFLLLPVFVPGFSALENPNALFFILTVGGLVVMASTLRQRYLGQIDLQTQLLFESEARLRELSVRDSLTGLFNRRYLEEVLELEMIRAGRKPYPIGIIMVDIDHFKRINDTHGHAAGDAVLVEAGRLLRTYVRASDVVCRYGGEEFVVILPEASQAITQLRAEQICDAMRRLHIEFAGRNLETITLSLGVASFPDHGSTIDAILGAADKALYRAKHNGRDRVILAA
jgi:diguanylate cyclase (GGDEF)-like protein